MKRVQEVPDHGRFTEKSDLANNTERIPGATKGALALGKKDVALRKHQLCDGKMI